MRDFADLLDRYPRLAITGAPKTGKTTLTQGICDRPVVHTDDWIDWPWEDVPELVQVACAEAGESFVVEGVQVARTLRKGLEVDAVVWLSDPKDTQIPAHISMGRGIHTVLAEWIAANPDVPLITEECFVFPSLTHDKADSPAINRRYVTFTLDRSTVKPTPQGGLRIRARASKAGVFSYNRQGRIVREYRPAEELQRPEAIESLRGSPIVVLHPDPTDNGEVTTRNAKRLKVGHFEDPEWNPQTQCLEGWALIDDEDTLKLIEQWGGADISCGYDCQRPWVPGFTPTREPYDTAQVNYIFNHVAIGPPGWGRQGQDVGLTLDSNDNEIAPIGAKDDSMKNGEKKTEITNDSGAGEQPKPPTDPTQDEGGTPTPPAAAVTPDGGTLSPDEIVKIRALLARLDQPAPAPAPAPVAPAAPAAPTADQTPPAPAAAPTEEKKTLDAADIDALAQERAEAMRVLGPEYVATGKPTRQLRVDVIKTLDSAFDDKGKSDDELKGSFAMTLRALATRNDPAEAFRRELGQGATHDAADRNPYKKLGHDLYS